MPIAIMDSEEASHLSSQSRPVGYIMVDFPLVLSFGQSRESLPEDLAAPVSR